MEFKDFKITFYILGSIIAALAIVYLLLTLFYSQRFFKGTVINGVDVSRLTVNETNRVLVDDSNDPVFVIVNGDNKQEITGSRLNLKASYLQDVREIKNSQNPFLWYLYNYMQKEYSANERVVSDRDTLAAQLAELPILNEDKNNKKVNLRIVKGINGYELSDNTVCPIDFTKLATKLSKAIVSGDELIDCSDCYTSKTYTPEQQRVIDEYEILETVQNNEIHYVDENISCTAGRPVIAKWIVVDENNYPVYDEHGNIMLDDEAIMNYIDLMSRLFDTGSEEGIQWTKHDGSKVMVQPCYTYKCYEVNKEEELNLLKKDLLKGTPVERKPLYLQEGQSRQESFPDTYVEVDMGEQKLYFYKEGKLTIESDVVTGLMSVKDRNTPACMANIYFKQKDRTLRGPDYESFVHYWMAFNKGVGLHDASWRHGKFGGNIYKTAGSHGCVNLPTSVAAELYDYVDVGTLVVTYY